MSLRNIRRVSASELATIRAGLPRQDCVEGSGLAPLANSFAEQGSVGGHSQLFLLRICGLDFLQLVLYLPGPGSRIESESQRILRHASAFAMSVCSLLGGAINDGLTKWHGPRLGRCGVAAFGIAVAGIFIAFGSQVDSARLASVVLAGGAGHFICRRVRFGRSRQTLPARRPVRFPAS